ncbi:unnamed protein product [Schistocephalus solidus]|uniref:Uncharacterized protein n=1 Tax=Schistocephalus solidus TaxID=70667 RepID=A0A183SG79_SCHSO|nr:unnamed protein product [Schistocephalus solidus]
MPSRLLPLVTLLLQVQCFGGFPDSDLIDSLTFNRHIPPVTTVPKSRQSFNKRHPPPPIPPQTLGHTRDRDQSSIPVNATSSNGEQICPGIVCFVIQRNGGLVLDCQLAAPWVNDNSIQMLECTIWQPPNTPLRSAFGGGNDMSEENPENGGSSAKSIRIRLRPERPSVYGIVTQRMSVDRAENNALLRLCSAVRAHLQLSARSQLKLSLSMLQIRKLSHHDLSRLFSVAQVSDLILWNPETWEETSLLDQPPGVVAVSPFIRLTVYCEAGNAEPAFSRLWIPWSRWQIKFRQCRGRYICYPWPPGQPLCCSPERCTQLPHFVLTQKSGLSREATSSEQYLAHYTCEPEPRQADNPLAELHFRQGCWSLSNHPRDTTPEAPEVPSASTAGNWTPLVSTRSTASLASAQPTPNSTVEVDFSVTGSDLSTGSVTIGSLASADVTDERTRMQRLVVGIVCLLMLNILLLVVFVTIGCLLRHRLRRRRKPSLACQIISASNANDLVQNKVNPGQPNFNGEVNGTLIVPKNMESAPNGFHSYQPEFTFPPVSLPIHSKEEQQLLSHDTQSASTVEVCLSSPTPPSQSTFLQRLRLNAPWRRSGRTSHYKHTLVIEHPNTSPNVDWGIKNLHPL